MIPITKKTSTKKSLLIVTGIILVILLGGLTYIYAFNGNLFGWPKNNSLLTTDMNPPSDDQIEAGNKIKQDTVNKTSPSEDSKTPSTDQPPIPTPQPDGKSTVEISISSLHQTSTNLQIRTFISSVQNSGTCNLTLTKPGSSSVSLTAGVQSLPTSSTCKGFDIPLSQLSTGDWQATLRFENETLIGDTTKKVIIQ